MESGLLNRLSKRRLTSNNLQVEKRFALHLNLLGAPAVIRGQDEKEQPAGTPQCFVAAGAGVGKAFPVNQAVSGTTSHPGRGLWGGSGRGLPGCCGHGAASPGVR